MRYPRSVRFSRQRKFRGRPEPIPSLHRTNMSDNRPQFDVQAVRLSIFSKGNYNLIKNQLVRILLDADFFLSDRRYLDYDSETGYHQYVLDVEKHYEME